MIKDVRKWIATTRSYEVLLGVFAGILVFPKPATIGVILIILYHLLNWRNMSWKRGTWISIGILGIPLLLDALFLWNNDSLWEGLQNGEKHLSSLLLPLFLLANTMTFRKEAVLKIYSIIFTAILVAGLMVHMYNEASVFENYLYGKEVWRMGYRFAGSLGVHAPALNMHVAFLLVVNTWLLFNSFVKNERNVLRYGRLFIFLLSFAILLALNTRLAVLNSVLGILLVAGSLLYKRVSRRRFIALMSGTVIFIFIAGLFFVRTFPYMIEKYTVVTFKHMDKVGQLDTLENPEAEAYNGLVTRVSIWQTAWHAAKEHWLVGVGAADARDYLVQEYRRTGQQFLYRHAFPTHNQYLDSFLKFGIIGFLGILIFWGHQIWVAWQLQDVLAWFMAWLFFSSNLTDDFLVRFDGIVFWAFWFSFFTKLLLQRVRDREPSAA